MTTDIKELVKRLRDGWSGSLRHAAADALEAMAGEVEKRQRQIDRLVTLVELLNSETHRAVCETQQVRCVSAERDRVKAALEAFVKHFGPLQDNAMLHEDVRNCYRLARKALGGDAS